MDNNEGKGGDQCQCRLLAAAEILFAEKGYAGTSIRDITKASQCNVAAVNYYFNGKENLYIEVFREHLTKMREVRIKSIDESMEQVRGVVSLERLIRGFSEAFIESVTDPAHDTLFCDLMTREMLDPHLPKNMFFEEYVQPIQLAFFEALRQIYPDLAPQLSMMCVISLIGQLNQIVMIKRAFGKRNEENTFFPDIQKMIDHIVNFSVAGFESVITSV